MKKTQKEVIFVSYKIDDDESISGWIYHGTYFNKKKDGWGKQMSPDRSQFWEGYFESKLVFANE